MAELCDKEDDPDQETNAAVIPRPESSDEQDTVPLVRRIKPLNITSTRESSSSASPLPCIVSVFLSILVACIFFTTHSLQQDTQVQSNGTISSNKSEEKMSAQSVDNTPLATSKPTAAPTVKVIPKLEPAYRGPPLSPLASSCDDYNRSSLQDYQSFLDKMSKHDELRCDVVRNPGPCPCLDPQVPAVTPFKGIAQRWNKTRARNQELLVPYLTNTSSLRPLDVLLFGDSITEHWLGTDLGMVGSGQWIECHQVYQELFLQPDSLVSGLALGIGGDRTTQLLYRLQHGEYPDELHVPIVWINIGTNDVAGDHCNADAIAAGNIAVIQHLFTKRPMRIVVNSILPRGNVNLAKDRKWQILRRVNHQLSCFAESMPGVEFVNTTALFLADDTNKRNVTLYADDTHPSAQGYRVWGQFIVKRVQEIKAELLKNNAEP